MGCCGKKPQDDDPNAIKNGMVPSAERKCRDVLCCLLFVAYWLGMIIVAMIGLKQGNAKKLIMGKDYTGSVCGDGALQSTPLVYYPRINEDMLYALTNNIPVTDMQYYGVCVPKCPVVGEKACKPDNSTCWTVTMKTENIFFRCLPIAEKKKDILNSTCLDPVNADPTCNLDRFLQGKCTAVCKVRQVESKVLETEESTPNPLLDQLQGWATLLGRLSGDVANTGGVVLGIGGAGAFALGLVWLILLQKFAACLVWLTCFLVVMTLVALSLYCSMKGNVISPATFPALQSLSPQLIADAEKLKAHASEIKQFEIAAYFCWGFTAILFVMILFMRKRIKIAIAIIREASRCIQRMPFLLLWPAVPSVLVLILMLYFMTISAYILSSDSISLSDVSNTVNQASGGNVNVALSAPAVTANLTSNVLENDTSIPLGAMPSASTKDLVFLYHLFGFLWTNQLIQAISICTIGGAVAQYYWTLPDDSGKRDVGRFPIASALKRVMRFHLGSLCFGAFIIALVQLIRCILEYIDHNTKNLQDANKMVKILMKVVKCCLWCFEKCLKFLSKNAYIIIAMKGNSFCTAARKAFTLILMNIARVTTVNSISFFLLLLVKVTITAGVGIFVFSNLSTNPIYMEGGSSEISSPFAPLIVACLLAWFVSSTFMNVYDMAIDTILVCFCEDSSINNQGASAFMSEELRKIMGDTGDTKATKVQVQPKKGGASEL